MGLSVPRVLASDSNRLKHCVATHANRHHSSNILRAKTRKTERNQHDAVGELVSAASDSSKSNRLKHCVWRGATQSKKKSKKKDMPLMWESSLTFL